MKKLNNIGFIFQVGDCAVEAQVSGAVLNEVQAVWAKIVEAIQVIQANED